MITNYKTKVNFMLICALIKLLVHQNKTGKKKCDKTNCRRGVSHNIQYARALQ